MTEIPKVHVPLLSRINPFHFTMLLCTTPRCYCRFQDFYIANYLRRNQRCRSCGSKMILIDGGFNCPSCGKYWGYLQEIPKFCSKCGAKLEPIGKYIKSYGGGGGV